MGVRLHENAFEVGSGGMRANEEFCRRFFDRLSFYQKDRQRGLSAGETVEPAKISDIYLEAQILVIQVQQCSAIFEAGQQSNPGPGTTRTISAF